MFLINLQGKSSICDQIRDQIMQFIKSGILKAGDKLPSVRQLAQELAINPNTVQKAYQELEKQGYIYTLQKKGAYVADAVDETNDAFYHDRFLKSVKEYLAYGFTMEQLRAWLDDYQKEDHKQ